MKRLYTIFLILFISTFAMNAQECLQKALNRSDFDAAVHIIDSLMASENADSVGLALQKARCLRKMYRADEAATAIGEVLHIDKFNIEMMAELAECHTQAGNTADAYKTINTPDSALVYYNHLLQMKPGHVVTMSKKALEYYERYLKLGKPGSSGYKFVEESIKYVKQELFMEN